MTDEIYLSILTLNRQHPDVKADLADAQRLHRRVMDGFPKDHLETPRAQFGVLFRLVPQGLWVQSNTLPSWSGLPPGYLHGTDMISRVPVVEAGVTCRFVLTANPTRKVDTKSVNGQRRNGRRVPLGTEDERLAWLTRKGEAGGFEILTIDGSDHGRIRSASKGVTLETVTFRGMLRVTDTELFRSTLADGIGPGKAYGCGLLSISLEEP